MIGKLIPAGTGMKRYGAVDVDYGENEPLMQSSFDGENMVLKMPSANLKPQSGVLYDGIEE